MSNHDNLVSVQMANGIELVLPVSSNPDIQQEQIDLIRNLDRNAVIRPVTPDYDPSNDYAAAEGSRYLTPSTNADGNLQFALMADDLGLVRNNPTAVADAFRMRDSANKSAAAAAAAASRQYFYETENAKIDAEYLKGSSQRSQESFARDSAYYAEMDSLSLEQFAQRRAYNAESAALDIKGATGQAAYNQSQLDRSLEGIGLDAVDYRRGESITADPYRALEADQTGVASGQRRYAQDVRAAAAASEEKKIALAQQKVAEAKAESDRALGLAMQGIQSAQRNADRQNDTGWAIYNAQSAREDRNRKEDKEESAATDKRYDAAGIAMSVANGTMFITTDGIVHNNIPPLPSEPEESLTTIVAAGAEPEVEWTRTPGYAGVGAVV